MSFVEIAGKVLKPLLMPFAMLYGLIMAVRNHFYNKNWFSSIEFSKPVISVGNLSTGGTGKTPHIEYLIELLQYQYKVATLSRGYKRRTQGFRMAEHGDSAYELGDEPMQYFAKFPELLVAVGENRILAIPQMLQKRPDIDVILLDDAFQHRSVKPGVNILITDYSHPFYKDHILPMGSLREGRSAYKRADIIIVSKCPNKLDDAERKQMIEAIQPLAHQQVFFTGITYNALFDFYTKEIKQPTKEASVILVAGIAQPEPMQVFLEQHFEDVHLLKYPDHHYFHPRDIEEMMEVYRNKEQEQVYIITTEKDAMRLAVHKDLLFENKINVLVLPIKVKFLGHQAAFDLKIMDYIEKERAENLFME